MPSPSSIPPNLPPINPANFGFGMSGAHTWFENLHWGTEPGQLSAAQAQQMGLVPTSPPLGVVPIYGSPPVRPDSLMLGLAGVQQVTYQGQTFTFVPVSHFEYVPAGPGTVNGYVVYQTSGTGSSQHLTLSTVQAEEALVLATRPPQGPGRYPPRTPPTVISGSSAASGGPVVQGATNANSPGTPVVGQVPSPANAPTNAQNTTVRPPFRPPLATPEMVFPFLMNPEHVSPLPELATLAGYQGAFGINAVGMAIGDAAALGYISGPSQIISDPQGFEAGMQQYLLDSIGQQNPGINGITGGQLIISRPDDGFVGPPVPFPQSSPIGQTVSGSGWYIGQRPPESQRLNQGGGFVSSGLGGFQFDLGAGNVGGGQGPGGGPPPPM